MTRLLQGELIKVRTTRTAFGFGVTSVLLVIALVLLSTLASDPQGIEEKRDALNVGGVLSMPLLLFGIVGATGEYRHRTLAPAVLIAASRVRLATMRLLAYMLTALVVGIAMIVTALVLGVPLLGAEEGPDLRSADYVRVIGGGLLTTTLSAAIGVGVGLLVRNQVAGVIGAVSWLFIAEQVITGLIDEVSGYGILNAASAVGGADNEFTFSFAGSLAVLAAWAVLFIVAGLVAESRRDVD